MAFADVLALGAFQDLLPVSSITFECPRQMATMTLGDGEVLGSEVADQRWRGTITLAADEHADMEAAIALINSMTRASQKFRLTPPQIAAAQNELADAQLLSTSAPNLAALSLLSPNEEIPRGHYFCIEDNSVSPQRYFLHRYSEALTADGVGQTVEGEIEPPLDPAISAGATLRRDRPVLNAKIMPNSFRGALHVPVTSQGVSFDWVQTLR